MKEQNSQVRKVNPPIAKEQLIEEYLMKGRSLRQIAESYSLSASQIRHWMIKFGIPRRPKAPRKLKVTKEELRKLYWEEGWSTRQIGRKYKVAYATVRHRMVKLGILRRKVGGTPKYLKTPFSGDPTEEAYLLGLRAGDLSARRHRQQIKISTLSTHPAMLKLFHEIFEKYGRVNEYPCFNAHRFPHYGWKIYGLVDQSFKFLLRKLQRIPEEILNNDDLFWAFLAGYIDSEGSLVITRKREDIKFACKIGSEDYQILTGIKDKLAKTGYHPLLRLERKRGIDKRPGSYSRMLKEDLWRLELCRKDEVLRLVQSLPIHNDEKIRRRKLMLEIKDCKKWSEVKDKIIVIHREIRNEVKRCIARASQHHRSRPLDRRSRYSLKLSV